ncbi:hypothetical protein Tco_0936021 [Tanacetum coccineum]
MYTICLGEVYHLLWRSISFAWEKYTSFTFREVYHLLGKSIPFASEKYTSFTLGEVYHFLGKKKYEELSVTEKLQADCDLKATNIVLQGLPPDVYAIVNHHKVAKEIQDRVKLLMQGTELSLQEKECKLYDKFNKFSFVKGETLYQYYWRFAQLINNMNVINMSMRPV